MPTYSKTLGVIGGMGPLATAYFLELITKMTDAATDQDHLEVLIHSRPAIPDRTKYILGESNRNPVNDFLWISKNMMLMGCGAIAIPCMTAHYFYPYLDSEIPITVINGVHETVHALQAAGVRKVGIMATTGAIRAGVFQRELELHGMEAIVPDETHQTGVMSLIYDDVKAHCRQPNIGIFNKVGNHLREQGAEVIILGCTELSIAKREFLIGPGYIDALEVLAKASILACGKQVKPQYDNLITSY